MNTHTEAYLHTDNVPSPKEQPLRLEIDRMLPDEAPFAQYGSGEGVGGVASRNKAVESLSLINCLLQPSIYSNVNPAAAFPYTSADQLAVNSILPYHILAPMQQYNVSPASSSIFTFNSSIPMPIPDLNNSPQQAPMFFLQPVGGGTPNSAISERAYQGSTTNKFQIIDTRTVGIERAVEEKKQKR